MRGAIELVDVALPVTHMHAALGRANERDGLAQVLQQAVALLRLDRHARGIDVPLERERSLELRSRPELRRRQTEGCAGEGDGQARMHQHLAQSQHVGLPALVARSRRPFRRDCGARAASEGPILLQDTTEFIYSRAQPGKIGFTKTMLPVRSHACQRSGRPLRCRPVAAGRRDWLARRADI